MYLCICAVMLPRGLGQRKWVKKQACKQERWRLSLLQVWTTPISTKNDGQKLRAHTQNDIRSIFFEREREKGGGGGGGKVLAELLFLLFGLNFGE